MSIRNHPLTPGTGRLVAALAAAVFLGGCMTPHRARTQADKVADNIIAQKQDEALGHTEPFTIETPADTLRRRLMLEQDLPHSAPASLNSKEIDPVKKWPKDNYLEQEREPAFDPEHQHDLGETLHLTLLDALQIGASSSRDYQSRKESVYISALNLDLERDEFRATFQGTWETIYSIDETGSPVRGVENSGALGLSKRFLSGANLTTRIGIDLAKLLTQGEDRSRGLWTDATITIPLLRGSGKYIVGEPLTQAERNVVYQIHSFERFKRTFAVQTASSYLDVLNGLDEVQNAAENYKSLITATRRARRLADAGRLPEIQVDQATQDELSARDRWVNARQSYARRLDSFKNLLGLPTDASVELETAELTRLADAAAPVLERVQMQAQEILTEPLPADAPVTLAPPSREEAGPYELEEDVAVKLALENRLDLRTAKSQVEDAQRKVVVAADGLRAELTLGGSMSAGERRGLGSATADDASIQIDEGRYDGSLTLDLPLERTAERNVYRASLIDLEAAARDLQELEDSIKLDVRNSLRNLVQSRSSLRIESVAVRLAARRVASTDLLLQAGRAEIRDLLEAQEDLVNAQDAMTRALVDYRIAELELQRDMGVLEIDDKGMWTEFDPEGLNENG